MSDQDKKKEAIEGMEKMDLQELDEISGGDLTNVVIEPLKPLSDTSGTK